MNNSFRHGDRVRFKHNDGEMDMVIVGRVIDTDPQYPSGGDLVKVREEYAASVWGESDNAKGSEHIVPRDQLERR